MRIGSQISPDISGYWIRGSDGRLSCVISRAEWSNAEWIIGCESFASLPVAHRLHLLVQDLFLSHTPVTLHGKAIVY